MEWRKTYGEDPWKRRFFVLHLPRNSQALCVWLTLAPPAGRAKARREDLASLRGEGAAGLLVLRRPRTAEPFCPACYFAAAVSACTRFSVVACSGASLPSMIDLQLVVIVS